MDSAENGSHSPAGGGIVMKKHFLAKENILEWFPPTFFPSTHREISIAFTTSREESFLFCTNGLLLRVPSIAGQAFEVRGKTSPFNTGLFIRKTDQGYHMKGIVFGETADYTIEPQAGSYVIKGDTGKFRSNYTILAGDNEIKVEGDTGQFNSKIIMTMTENGYTYSGFAEGDKMEITCFEECGEYHFVGSIAAFPYDLLIGAGEGSIRVSGTQANRKTDFTVKEVPEGVVMEGVIKSDRFSYLATRDEKHFAVTGAYNGPVDYVIKPAVQPSGSCQPMSEGERGS